MRQLSFTAEPQCCDPALDWTSPLINGLYALWLPATEPRLWLNAARLNARRGNVPSEYWAAYSQRRTLSAAAASGLAIPTASGGNVPTSFGTALACSNEQIGWNSGAIADAPSWIADGTGRTITVCLWFRLNRVNGSGYPTLCGTSFSTGWWLGLRTGTGAYKAILRNAAFPYGAFEWGSYNADLRRLTCVVLVLPFDANGTASLYHNGVLAVQGTLPNGSGVSGYANVFPLSSSNTGMFVEIFGLACWARTLFADEIRELVAGPRTLLERQQTLLYGPMLAYRAATIDGQSELTAVRYLGAVRAARIEGTSSLFAYRRPPDSAERTWSIAADRRCLTAGPEPRTVGIRPESRTVRA
jgi:hypothetical protein